MADEVKGVDGLPFPASEIMQLNPGDCVTISEGHFCLLHRRDGSTVVTGESVAVDITNLRKVLLSQDLRIVGEAEWAVLEAMDAFEDGEFGSSWRKRAEAAEAEVVRLRALNAQNAEVHVRVTDQLRARIAQLEAHNELLGIIVQAPGGQNGG